MVDEWTPPSASNVLSTLMVETPKIKILSPGLKLDNIPDRFQRYMEPWNSRNWAHRLPTGFSSFKLTEDLEPLTGIVDFCGDWDNVKKLLKSSESNESLSLILHRFGKTIFIDNFDLINLYLRPGYNEWPWFAEFSKDRIGKDRSIVFGEGKSLSQLYNKAAVYKILYFSLLEDLKIKNEVSKAKINDVKSFLTPQLEGSQHKFLKKVSWKVEDYTMILGIDVPVFDVVDEVIHSRVTINSVDTTLRNSLCGLDMWLENIMLGAEGSLIYHHKDWVVTKRDWIRTEGIPRASGFKPEKAIKDGTEVLGHLKEKINRRGDTYWLYKAPEQTMFKIYNLSKKVEDRKIDCTNPMSAAYVDLVTRITKHSNNEVLKDW